MNSPGEGGTLRVSSRLPRAPGGRGCRAGGKHPPLPAPSPSFSVMHFLRPRIPFVLKFKKIRPPRAAVWARGAGLGAGEGIPEWAARGSRPRGQGFGWGVSRPAGLLASPLGRSRPPPSPSVPSRLCCAETELTWAVSPTRRAKTTAGGSVGSLSGKVGRERRGRPCFCLGGALRPRKPTLLL